jgi:TRAP-type mannitol/chloroaromatic compound transport system permease large subunit
VFTPTEAGGIGSFGALFCRSNEKIAGRFRQTVELTAKNTCMVFLIIIVLLSLPIYSI